MFTKKNDFFFNRVPQKLVFVLTSDTLSNLINKVFFNFMITYEKIYCNCQHSHFTNDHETSKGYCVKIRPA